VQTYEALIPVKRARLFTIFTSIIYRKMKTIIAGADHAGFEMKQHLVEFLQNQGYNVIDKGTYSADSVDYPDFAHAVAEEVESGADNTGLLLCGSANGVAITANRHSGIRAAICWKEDIAKLARQHNDANVICIPARFVSETEAEKMLIAFLNTQFEGGRHQRRVEKIEC
jgi:ribose 5-phosphate isomerase B